MSEPKHRKILIATPLKGGLPPEYFQGLFNAINSKIPGISIAYCFLGGTSIQWARDEIAKYVLDAKFDELIFWDKDLNPHPQQLIRLISHDEPVVCSVYCKRGVKTVWHIDMMPEQPRVREDGLLYANRAAIGFSKIKREVFEEIRRKQPQRFYVKQDNGADPVEIFEYFPMGLVGPNTAEGKLERIHQTFKKAIESGVHFDEMRVADIWEILNDSDYSTNRCLGEDFYFCRLLKECGIPLLVDPQLIINHMGETSFPIPTPLLVEELMQEWRGDERDALLAKYAAEGAPKADSTELMQFQK